MKIDWGYIKWKIIEWPRLEFIYFLGGIPKEHVNTVNYKNIDTIMGKIMKKIEDTTPPLKAKE